MTNIRRPSILSRLITLLVLLWLGVLPAAAQHAGVVEALTGTAYRHAAASASASPLAVGSPVDSGDTLTTDPAAELVLRMDDGGVISLRNGSSMRIDEYLADGSAGERSYFSLLKGAMRSVTGWIGKTNPAGYRVTTPIATIGIRGTDHEIVILEDAFDGQDEAGIYDIVYDGATYMHTTQGEVDAVPGLPAFMARDGLHQPLQLRQLPAFQKARKLLLDAVLERVRDEVRDKLPQLRDERIKGLLRNIGVPSASPRVEKMDERRPGGEEADRKGRDLKRDRPRHGPRDHADKPGKTPRAHDRGRAAGKGGRDR